MGSTAAPHPSSFFHRRVCFRADGTSGAVVTQGIEFVRRALAEWCLSSPADGPEQACADDAQLVAAELLSNAEQHGRGARELRLDFDIVDECLWIAVTDANPSRVPQPVEPHRPDRGWGHGLHILSLLAVWGTSGDHGGKTVWAKVLVPAPYHGRPHR